MACKTCFEDWICKCLPYDSQIVIRAYLPAGTYTVVVTDKFDNKYDVEVIVEGVGNFFAINIDDFPEGLFFDTVKIEVMAEDGCTPIKIPILSEYDCIELTGKGGTMDKSTVGCDF